MEGGEMNQAANKAMEMCHEKGGRLLYLTKFGSHLYGTNTEDSDLDLKGVFLPPMQEMVMGHHTKTLSYSSGSDNTRNTSEDMDIQLWSLQYWLELLAKGEVNAIDLLFSPSNTLCVKYLDDILMPVFEEPLDYIDPLRTNAYVGYAIGQAKKYGIKGSRARVILDVADWIEGVKRDSTPEVWDISKLQSIVDILVQVFGDGSYCFRKELRDGEWGLVLCGKVHMETISLEEFHTRLQREKKRYGERALKAREGVDWKALSHAVRAIRQTEELMIHGEIDFPLLCAGELVAIKQGLHDWETVEAIITSGLEQVNTVRESLVKSGRTYPGPSRKAQTSLIFNAYGVA
jgi:predicted nucleotidyltransferase